LEYADYWRDENQGEKEDNSGNIDEVFRPWFGGKSVKTLNKPKHRSTLLSSLLLALHFLLEKYTSGYIVYLHNSLWRLYA
jgi:hypothetical protein